MGRPTRRLLIALPLVALPLVALPLVALSLVALASVASVTLLPAALHAQDTGAPKADAIAVRAVLTGRRVDHGDWNAVLSRHVRLGRVDYAGIAKDSAFTRYLATLATTTIDGLDEAERLAFWLNAYNAWTVQLVIAHGERQSIRNINRTLGVLRLKGPWSEPIGEAAGRRWTLDEVQHRILRHQFREPRIHFALVPAARGAPPLRNEAYDGMRLNEQLESQARQFLADTTRNRYVRGGVFLSPIFIYYRTDFAATQAEIGGYLAKYFPAGREVLEKGRFFMRPTDFDWSLNGIATPRTTRQSP